MSHPTFVFVPMAQQPLGDVTQRTREIAIRMALGASSGDMQAMVLKQAARLGAIGGVIGLVLAGAIGVLVRGPPRARRAAAASVSVSRRHGSQLWHRASGPLDLKLGGSLAVSA